jgi:hypothetical protein
MAFGVAVLAAAAGGCLVVAWRTADAAQVRGAVLLASLCVACIVFLKAVVLPALTVAPRNAAGGAAYARYAVERVLTIGPVEDADEPFDDWQMTELARALMALEAGRHQEAKEGLERALNDITDYDWRAWV